MTHPLAHGSLDGPKADKHSWAFHQAESRRASAADPRRTAPPVVLTREVFMKAMTRLAAEVQFRDPIIRLAADRPRRRRPRYCSNGCSPQIDYSSSTSVSCSRCGVEIDF